MSSRLLFCHTWSKRRRCFRYHATVGRFRDFGFFIVCLCLWFVVNNSHIIFSFSTCINQQVKRVMLILIAVRWEMRLKCQGGRLVLIWRF
jgi:hypothetical protein